MNDRRSHERHSLREQLGTQTLRPQERKTTEGKSNRIPRRRFTYLYRHDGNADGNDHEHVEGSRSNDCSWAQVTGLEIVPNNLVSVGLCTHCERYPQISRCGSSLTSMTASRISGADDPSAISDKLDTVLFHTATEMSRSALPEPIVTRVVSAVMASIEPIYTTAGIL